MCSVVACRQCECLRLIAATKKKKKKLMLFASNVVSVLVCALYGVYIA